jgi:eukaryotic-like serine/threonine-protein kinase
VLTQIPKSIKARRRLQRASRARAAIDHPNVLAARMHSERDGRIGTVIARSPQPAISELVQSRPLEVEQCVRIMTGACMAVDAMTRSGLVPRDLTPDRVYVHPDRGGLLGDSGMPLDLVPRPAMEVDRELAYRSPEELDGKPRDERSVVYSLGAVLFTALTGLPPFGGTWSNVYLAHSTAPRPRAAEQRDGVPPKLDAAIARAMAIDPADRYASPSEFASALGSPARRQERPEPAPVPAGAETTRPAAAASNGRPAKPARPAKRTAAASNGRPAEAAEAAKPTAAPKANPRAKRSSRAKPAPPPAPATRPAEAIPAPPTTTTVAPDERVPRVLAAVREQTGSRPPLIAVPKPLDAQNGKAADSSVAAPKRRPPRGHASTQSKAPTRATVRRADGAEPPHPTRRSSRAGTNPRSWRALAIVGVLAVGAIGAVAFTGRDEHAQTAERYGVGPLSVSAPAGWERSQVSSARFAGLTAAPLGITSGDGRTELVAAVLPGQDDAERVLAGALPNGTEPAPVRIGRVELARYAGLGAGPGRTGYAYVLHTTGDSLLAVCRAPVAERRALAACGRVASTLRIRGERPVSPAVAEQRRVDLYAALRRLRDARVAGRQRIATAVIADEQVEATGRLEAIYLQAARAIADTGMPGAGAAALVNALEDTAGAYGELATAIANGDQAAYDEARAAVLEAEAGAVSASGRVVVPNPAPSIEQ